MTPADTAPAAADDVRPVVATGGSGRLGLIAGIAALLLGGAWIFSAMTAQRTAQDGDGELAIVAPDNGLIASPPPLAVPPGYDDRGPVPQLRYLPRVVRAAPYTPVPGPVYRPDPEPRTSPASTYTPQEPAYDIPPPVPYSGPAPVAEPAPSAGGGEDGRISAARFRNPSLTVPQGTVIPAVLETALDSTRPGGVRALVQGDIYSFDGSRVLIHRGSRLYGEYEGDLQRGQNRALIRWTRLIRPDGVTIALDSPASDPLGRAGVKGKVDSKFFQRFGGALLQSVLDIGVGIAASRATDGVIVALPGSTQNVTPRAQQTEVMPTLKVRHGTSVSVFVAHDLDFSAVET